MTRSANARVAGATYLLYIALAFPTLFLSNAAIAAVLTLLASVNAIVLAVALWAITRDEDRDLAAIALMCRVAEGTLGVAGVGPVKGGFLFAVGSTIFCYLLLRGRMIPVGLAWLGVVASLLLVVLLPMQLAGLLGRAVAQGMWIPMALFEIPLGFLLLFRGVRPASHATENESATRARL